jgi:hypothetical protein
MNAKEKEAWDKQTEIMGTLGIPYSVFCRDPVGYLLKYKKEIRRRERVEMLNIRF